MEFKTLETTAPALLADVFNQAFAAYAIPMQWTPDSLLQKIRVEDIDLTRSVGAFDGAQLVGFIVFGIGPVRNVPCAWDGGTGVLPAYRGQKLTQRMFEAILPRLHADGIRRILLEVLDSNTTARHLYQRLGFRETRLLHAFGGAVAAAAASYPVEVATGADRSALSHLGEVQPAWQQLDARIRNWGDAVTAYMIRESGRPVAYAQYNPGQKRVLQFATAPSHRRQGLATALFHHIAQGANGPVQVVNVDEGAAGTIAFLKAMGLEPFISQHEMALDLGPTPAPF